MIRTQALSYHFEHEGQRLPVLDDIHLEIPTGQSLAIVGQSGSGKTTLLGLLAGLDVPSSGQIDIDGQRISQMSEDERAHFRAQRVGFVFQSFHLLPSLSALDNVALPLNLFGQAQTAQAAQGATERAAEFLQRVGLGHRLDHYPSQLSGGEQQRVAIARAFATQPAYLFADEPTGNLDQNTGAHIMDLLFELQTQHQSTLVLVTHEPRLAQRCAHQLHLENGRATLA